MTTIAFSPDPRLAYWPTPPEVAEDVVLQALEPWHGRGDGVRVLEPSAGEGHLAAAVRVWLPEAHITCVEPCSDRAERLRARAGATDEVVEATLEEYLVRVAFEAMAGTWQGFHLVVMNPPFALQGRQRRGQSTSWRCSTTRMSCLQTRCSAPSYPGLS